MPKYLTASEVAERLHYSVWSVRALARAGILSGVRLRPGGKLLFDPAEVDAALERVSPQDPIEHRTFTSGEYHGPTDQAQSRSPAENL